jgi:hypothetical protein
MARPKGSKNKPKAAQEEPVKFLTKADVNPPVQIEAKPWSPKPEMGHIQPPTPAEKVCTCKHKGETHYGGPKGWCNVGGCNCQEFAE